MAGMHDDDAGGALAGQRQIVGDEDRRHAHFLGEIVDQIHDDGLRGHVEAGGRLIGDQERRLRGKRDRDHDALAHAARHFERIGFGAARRIGDADGAQHVDRLGRRVAPRHVAVADQHVGDLAADRADRIERGARILEDHRDLAAAHVGKLAGLCREQIEPAEHGTAGGDFAGGIENAHHRIGGDRFARAGFADQRDGLALVDGKAHIVERAHDAGAGAEFDAEAFDARAPARRRHVRLMSFSWDRPCRASRRRAG